MLPASPDDTSAFSVLGDNADGIAGIYFLGGGSAVPQSVREAACGAASV